MSTGWRSRRGWVAQFALPALFSPLLRRRDYVRGHRARPLQAGSQSAIDVRSARRWIVVHALSKCRDILGRGRNLQFSDCDLVRDYPRLLRDRLSERGCVCAAGFSHHSAKFGMLPADTSDRSVGERSKRCPSRAECRRKFRDSRANCGCSVRRSLERGARPGRGVGGRQLLQLPFRRQT
jgi:hypothetical protein